MPSATVGTIADLRALPVSGLSDAVLLGYYASGDGGGGNFVWEASNTQADDNGIVIKPNAVLETAPGRWRRIFAGPIDIRWFGGASDGIHYLVSDLQTSKVQEFATVLPSNVITPDTRLGCVFSIVLDGNLTVNDTLYPDFTKNFGTAFNSGVEIAFIFKQDAVGGRTVAFGPSFVVGNWVPDIAANSTSTIRFSLDASNKMWLAVYASPLVSASSQGSSFHAIEYPVSFAQATQDSQNEIPANSVVVRSSVNIVQSFDVGVTLSVGRPGGTSLLQTANQNDPTTSGQYEVWSRIAWGGTSSVVRTTINGVATHGSATILVEYVLPNT